MQATVRWDKNMAFSGETATGHLLKMDSAPEFGGMNTGPRPTELVLHAVAGCTGMDIISILKKMRLEPTSFQLDIEGERAPTPPKRFFRISLHYRFEGDLPEEKVVRAIELSKEKYCSVAHSLNAEISAFYSINGIKSERKL